MYICMYVCVCIREILVSRKTSGFCAEVVHRGQPCLILEHALKQFLYQWTQQNRLCFIKFDFLPIFCLPGLVPNSELPGSRGYRPFQIVVESFATERVVASPSVFHFRIRTRFQVPGFEWVHELLLFCLATNPEQFCAEISCGKTGLGHNFTDSRFRMKNDFYA